MLKVENTDVYGWEAAIRGMRNPLESWNKSDTQYFDGGVFRVPKIGSNDLKLMKKLSKAGNDHAKFLRMINVTCDITAPMYWWKQADQYRIGVTTNSTSTMHSIHKKEFTLDDFSHEHLIGDGVIILCDLIVVLNEARDSYLNFDEYYHKGELNEEITDKKDIWWQMIQLLPSSYNQKRTVQLNYQVLKSMYFARKGHRLDEWETLRQWMKTLPYFKEIVIQE